MQRPRMHRRGFRSSNLVFSSSVFVDGPGDSPGELSGCWNDVLNMKKYIMDVHGFEEENIVVLMDDGENIEPTARNIIRAYKKVVSEAEEGDAIFLHYSGEIALCLCVELVKFCTGQSFGIHSIIRFADFCRPRH